MIFFISLRHLYVPLSQSHVHQLLHQEQEETKLSLSVWLSNQLPEMVLGVRTTESVGSRCMNRLGERRRGKRKAVLWSQLWMSSPPGARTVECATF